MGLINEFSANGSKLPCPVRLDPYLKTILDSMYKRQLHNWDNSMLVVGEEGCGKTIFSFNNALYLDPDFNIDKVVFNPDQLYEAVDNVPRGSTIVWDEADAIGEHWASSVVQALKTKFKRIRKRNLNIITNTPTMFDLGKYFILSRMKSIFHIKALSINRDKVIWRFFTGKSKTVLYHKGLKQWNMDATIPKRWARSYNIDKNFPIDMSENGEYETKKDEATKNITEKLDLKNVYKKAYIKAISDIKFGLEKDYKIIPQDKLMAKWIGVSKSTFSKYMSSITKEI